MIGRWAGPGNPINHSYKTVLVHSFTYDQCIYLVTSACHETSPLLFEIGILNEPQRLQDSEGGGGDWLGELGRGEEEVDRG